MNADQVINSRSIFVASNLFGLRQCVSRFEYGLVGIALSFVKYAVELGVIAYFCGLFYTPFDFISPFLSSREKYLGLMPSWIGWAWLIWTLPFLWIGVCMSVRRAFDAGISPWIGLVILVPFLNILGMLVLAMVPTDKRSTPVRNLVNEREERDATIVAELADIYRPTMTEPGRLISPNESIPILSSAIFGIGVGAAYLVVSVLASVYALGSYGTAMFFGAPIISCAVSAYCLNRRIDRGFGVTCLHALVTLLTAAIISPVIEVRSQVIVEAPIESVWDHVIDFPEITDKPTGILRTGVAYPVRARIEGSGIGAIRYCEFSTGTFVEPITVWDKPNRLSFDVTSQPEPMSELSPYRHIHPPHLDGSFQSIRGEFRLMRLDGNRTRLEGITWYQIDLGPRVYWRLWTDWIIHRIHERVLKHVKAEAELGNLK